MPDHDHSYKLFFSPAQMVRNLLTGFIREDWFEQLNYGFLEHPPRERDAASRAPASSRMEVRRAALTPAPPTIILPW